MKISGVLIRRRERGILLTAAAVLLASWWGTGEAAVAEEKDVPLKWKTLRNEAALCNDFTRAGFFHRNATRNAGGGGGGKWVVFLESGAVCYSNETCNRRYFNGIVRNKYSDDARMNGGYGDFDTSAVFNNYRGTPGADYVNPLMTSIKCFKNTSFFPSGLELEGRDVFDRNLIPSHAFSNHGHVVVPYCSSDVWLGDETDESRYFPQKLANFNSSCECFDQNCFQYDPKAPGLQFTFRGKTIFKSVMEELDDIYNLRRAEELVLIGSSAGGVGAMNLAKWVKDEFPNLAVKVIADSAWFINFRDGINQQFTNLQNSATNDAIFPSDTPIPYSPSPISSLVTPSLAGSSLDSMLILATPTPISAAPTPISAAPTPISAAPTPISATPTPDDSYYSGSSGASVGSASGSGTTSSGSGSSGASVGSASGSGSGSGSSGASVGSASGSGSGSGSSDASVGSASGSGTTSSGSSGSGSGNSGSGFVSNEEDMRRSAYSEEMMERDGESNERYRREVTMENDLLTLLKSHEACYDIRRGYPCCLSAQCLLSSSSPETDEPYFPGDIPLFVVTSLYDAFILGRALSEVALYEESSDSTPIGLAVEYLTLVGEYGGAMETSLTEVLEAGRVQLSFYSSQCFQHIYFATSTLWGEGRLFGTDPVQIDPEIGTFRHSIRAGVWNTANLAYNDGNNYTIMNAIDVWYRNGTNVFRDVCQTPHCNQQCPEKFIFNSLEPKVWPVYLRVAVAAVVMTVALVCILLKACFYLWLKVLEHKQYVYLQSINHCQEDEEELSSPLSDGFIEEGLKREFPMCTPDQAISVACLNLHYSVTTRVGKQLKDEKKENFTPIVLSDLSPEDELNGSETDTQEERESVNCDEAQGERRRSRPLSLAALHKLKSAFTTNSAGPIRVPTFRPDNENIAESIKRMTNGTYTARRTSQATPHGRISRSSDLSQDTFDEVPLKQSRTGDVCSSMMKSVFKTKRKKILKGISAYFNPGEMVGIMGPSGCGKTTFLDILTGRRKSGNFSGQIFINGVPMEENRDWYLSNAGYVIQLARPYYEELTVRENLTLAAWIRLKDTAREKFQRVEQVMDVSGLLDLADTIVGGATGPGLSGGQKRRLAVALQLLKLPSVIFLDEPTSGLDAASSRELLAHLNELAGSNRTVVLTIHQPRLEIFHMFDRLVLLSDGKVAYHGVPDKAYEVFVNALRSRYLQQRLIIPDLEDRNPADVIMDMLGNQKMRQLITDYYQCTDEPKLVNLAVKKARSRERKYSMDQMDGNDGGSGDRKLTRWEQFKYILKGVRKAENTQNTLLDRVATLEARATKRATPLAITYLPIIFFAYGVLLGTVYLQQQQPLLIMSGFCVYSVASALFMFPALYTYYVKALEIYSFEHADGAGRAYDLVIQPFVRFITMAIIPVVACALILYVLLVHYTSWSWSVFGQLVVVNVALNQAWVALLILLIVSFPRIAIRLSPPLASIMGFTSGFFIPVNDIPWWYRWLTFINPNYYGFSASAFLLLENFETPCERNGNGTDLECYPGSGEYVLRRFNFDEINPYYNITVLLGMTFFFLLLSVFSNWCNHVTLNRGMKKVKLMASRIKRAASVDTASLFSVSIGYGEFDSDDDLLSCEGDLDDEREGFLDSQEQEEEEEEEEEEREEEGIPSAPLTPIAENQEDTEQERQELKREGRRSTEHEVITMERDSEHYPYPRYPHGANHLPTSLPEIPSAVSPHPLSSQDKARQNWMKAMEITKSQRSSPIEMDTFAAQSEPPTPEKHIVFRNGYQRSHPNRLNSLGDSGHRGDGRRKKSVRSVYLRDGEVHSVWKPKKTPSLASPTTPTPPPPNFADVVQEVMRQHGKTNLRERQRQLLSRVTATQAVLKEQNQELAAGGTMTDEEEEEDEKKKKEVGEKRSASTGGHRDTPSKMMWQQAIKSIINENKNDDDEKTKKRIRKRSTVRFHEVVTSKLATMDTATGTRGLPSISEQPAPHSPQKARRKTSLCRKRQEATTPSGAIPFVEWKNQFYERQRHTRQGSIKPCKSDYNLKTQASRQYSAMLPRINSDNNLSFPVHRRASAASVEDLEPRSKSVSQYHRMNIRRQSSPPSLAGYEDGGDMSDTSSVALDDMFSPLSSRSVSPSVFSDEEERRSKMQTSRTPVANKAHQPLVKLDSEETRVLSHPYNMHKRARNHHRPQYQDTTHTGDGIIEIEPPIDQSDRPTSNRAMTPTKKRRRPKKVSISLPSSPRGTPSPRPPTPESNLPSSSHVVSPPVDPRSKKGARRESTVITSPSALNDRITREQARRGSTPHIPKCIREEGEYDDQLSSPRVRAATPDGNYYHPPLARAERRSIILDSEPCDPRIQSRNPLQRASSPPPSQQNINILDPQRSGEL